MEIDIIKTDEEKQEIVRQIIKQKIVKTINNPNGLNVYAMDKNWKVKQIIFQNVQIQTQLTHEKEGNFTPDPTTKQIKRLRANVDPESVHLLALNKKNAIRKFKAIIEKSIQLYKQNATQQAIDAGLIKKEIH